MRSLAIIIIAAALGVSGLTFYLVKNYLQSQATASTPEINVMAVPTVQIVVAARDLPAGTILREGDTKWQAWPDQSLDDGFIVQRDGQGADRIDEFSGVVVRRAISAAEPMTTTKVFRREDTGYMAGALTPGMRAMSIRISAVSGASGFIMPGDKVDVILTQELRDTGETSGLPMRRASETILKNIRVLAIDQNTNDVEQTAVVGQTATLEVTPKQTEILSVANAMGAMSLALRSITPGGIKIGDSSYTSDLDVSAVLGGGTENAGTVKVYRSVEATTVRVGQ